MRPYLQFTIPAGVIILASAAGVTAADRLLSGSVADSAAAPVGAAVDEAVRVEAPASSSGLSPVAAALNGRGVHAFYFTRGIYSDQRSAWGGRRGSWSIDYPKADLQFLVVLRRLTNLDAYDSEHAVALDDPELRRYPFVYMLEVGGMALTESESEGLRSYMLAGGFVFIDDFWGPREWQNFEWQMQRVLPEYQIVDFPPDHPLLSSFYTIDEILQIPSINTVRRYRGTRTDECNGCTPQVRGIFDDDGRLMMLINWNTDLGDAWEWAEQPDYPTRYSTFAYQMGINAIVYAMSH